MTNTCTGTLDVPRQPSEVTSHRLRWPLPAVLGWGLGWLTYTTAVGLGAPGLWGVLVGTLAAAAIGIWSDTVWRAALVAVGFPLLMAFSSAFATVPAGWWLVPLALLLLAYPLKAWRDAPYFPTYAGALDDLPSVAKLQAAAPVLDAGCGLGVGLRALHGAYPQAQLHGIEWSAPLAWWARLRCRFASVRRGDMWASSWAPYSMVYVFQRPESMSRVMAKARREMVAGSWLVSLEFEAVGWRATACLRSPQGKPVWIYRVPVRRSARSAKSSATNGVPVSATA